MEILLLATSLTAILSTFIVKYVDNYMGLILTRGQTWLLALVPSLITLIALSSIFLLA